MGAKASLCLNSDSQLAQACLQEYFPHYDRYPATRRDFSNPSQDHLLYSQWDWLAKTRSKPIVGRCAGEGKWQRGPALPALSSLAQAVQEGQLNREDSVRA